MVGFTRVTVSLSTKKSTQLHPIRLCQQGECNKCETTELTVRLSVCLSLPPPPSSLYVSVCPITCKQTNNNNNLSFARNGMWGSLCRQRMNQSIHNLCCCNSYNRAQLSSRNQSYNRKHRAYSKPHIIVQPSHYSTIRSLSPPQRQHCKPSPYASTYLHHRLHSQSSPYEATSCSKPSAYKATSYVCTDVQKEAFPNEAAHNQ